MTLKWVVPEGRNLKYDLNQMACPCHQLRQARKKGERAWLSITSRESKSSIISVSAVKVAEIDSISIIQGNFQIRILK